MKEICGFLDNKGVFHKTKEKAETSNAELKVVRLQNFLDNFEREVSNIIFQEQGNLDQVEHVTKLDYVESRIYEQVSKVILSNSKEWQKLIREREEVAVELSILKSNLTARKWWLKFKWW